MMDEVTEDECLICRRWPAAERPDRRPEYFRQEFYLVPVDHICPACELAQWEKITATKH
jgi:hypothetical protein